MDSNTSATIEPTKMYDYLNGMAENPIVFILLALIIIAYFIFFVSLGNKGNGVQDSTSSSIFGDSDVDSGSNSGNGFIAIIVVVIFMLLVYNVFKYFFSIDIVASVSNLFKGGNQIDIKINQDSKMPSSGMPGMPSSGMPGMPSSGVPSSSAYTPSNAGQQVFNIPGNYYSYKDAKSLCKAYGSELATYDQVEQAYNDGSEFCNYGWSEGQMALFPTQKSTYEKLQKTEGHENDCGRPGINGGYMANPELQFGVNCYGYKPKITSEEEEMMRNVTPYPKSEKDILMEKKVAYWKSKLDEILVSPFNYTSWSKI
jgi:hypothetical protein